jgi:hypothetical protein
MISLTAIGTATYKNVVLLTLFDRSSQIIKPKLIQHKTFDPKIGINGIVLEKKGFNPLTI